MEMYGTRAARDALEKIRRRFKGERIRDPETLDWRALELQHGREGAYAAALKPCRAVVVLELRGAVGRGVAAEVALALGDGKPVHVLRNRQFLPVCRIARKDGQDWTRWGRLELGRLAPPHPHA